MTEDITSRDTIVIEESVHDIYVRLTEGDSIINAPFRTMQDVFMWAVCLGVQQGIRKPLTAKKKTVFRWAQFDPQTDIPLLKAIAIADSGDVNVLLKRNDILIVAEEYANTGIHLLRASLFDEHDQPLWNLVSLISQAFHE